MTNQSRWYFSCNQLIDKNVSEIINLHEYAGEFVGKPISIFDSVEIARAILSLDLPPSKLRHR
jgi:glyceraldehyde 3-phosphate dehydrogenase